MGATGSTSGAAGMGAAGATTGAGAAGAARPGASPAQKISGQSIKEGMIGEAVYNENDEKVGDVEDVVLDSDGKAKTFVIGAGGFLGMGEHDVAVPFDKITKSGDKLILQGYTKDQLKALPAVEVSK